MKNTPLILAATSVLGSWFMNMNMNKSMVHAATSVLELVPGGVWGPCGAGKEMHK